MQAIRAERDECKRIIDSSSDAGPRSDAETIKLYKMMNDAAMKLDAGHQELLKSCSKYQKQLIDITRDEGQKTRDHIDDRFVLIETGLMQLNNSLSSIPTIMPSVREGAIVVFAEKRNVVQYAINMIGDDSRKFEDSDVAMALIESILDCKGNYLRRSVENGHDSIEHNEALIFLGQVLDNIAGRASETVCNDVIALYRRKYIDGIQMICEKKRKRITQC